MAADICARLGKKIKEIRRTKGVYQIELAEQSKLTRRNLSRIETGQAEAGIRTLDRIARALGVPLRDLLDL